MIPFFLYLLASLVKKHNGLYKFQANLTLYTQYVHHGFLPYFTLQLILNNSNNIELNCVGSLEPFIPLI